MICRSLNVPGSPSSALTTRTRGRERAFGEESPLHPSGEAGAAPAAQVRLLDLLDNLLLRGGERLPQRLVPAELQVPVDAAVLLVGEMGGEDRFHRRLRFSPLRKPVEEGVDL